MAEFCKQCFMDGIMTSKEATLVEEGKIELIISKDNDFCEGCGRMLPVVLQVIEK